MSLTRRRLEKIAVVGPLIDVGNLGIPSGIGYAMGSGHDFVDEDDAQDYLDDGPSVGGTLLMPGYIGYGMGKRKRARKVVRKARRARRDKKASDLESAAVTSKLASEYLETGALGEQAQAAYEGIKEASIDSRHAKGLRSMEKVSNVQDLHVDPEESRQHRLNTLLRRY